MARLILAFVGCSLVVSTGFGGSIDQIGVVDPTPKLVLPLDLVNNGYAATFLKVTGSIPITRANGRKENVMMTMPVWARSHTIAIPEAKLPDLVALCKDLEAHAAKCRELEAETEKLRERWTALMSDPQNQQWSVPENE